LQFVDMKFTKVQKKVLEVFVTSADDRIYGVKNTVPNEVFGAFGSYFSRNPEDFRVHLLKAIEQGIEEGEGVASNNFKRLVDGKFWNPSMAIEQGLGKAQSFFKRWYGKYSHKSIANTVWIPMVGTDVSQLFARELAYDQLAFFIEQSTRYVKWDLNKMYFDPDIMKSRHAKLFTETLGQMASGYHTLMEEAVRYYRKINSYDKWLKRQTETVRNDSEKVQHATYDRQIRGAALDVSRFLLPQTILTNIAWIQDARSMEFDIAVWKGHPLAEMREVAGLMEKNAGEIVPSLLKYTEKNDFYSKQLNGFDLGISSARSFKKEAKVIACEKDSLNKAVAHLFKRYGVGGTFFQRYEEVKKMRFREKIVFLKKFVEKRGRYDEWVAVDEAFDQVKLCVEICTDLGAVRDWRRHQKWDRNEALYTTDNGIHRPKVIDEMSVNAGRVFDDVMDVARKAELVIRKDLPYQAQYVVPMASMHALTMTAGLDQMQYMLWTRSTPQGNFSYREDAFNLAEAFVKTHPWILGYEKYPEGLKFLEVYENAPLKGILRLQTGKTALHQ